MKLWLLSSGSPVACCQACQSPALRGDLNTVFGRSATPSMQTGPPKTRSISLVHSSTNFDSKRASSALKVCAVLTTSGCLSTNVSQAPRSFSPSCTPGSFSVAMSGSLMPPSEIPLGAPPSPGPALVLLPWKFPLPQPGALDLSQVLSCLDERQPLSLRSSLLSQPCWSSETFVYT